MRRSLAPVFWGLGLLGAVLAGILSWPLGIRAQSDPVPIEWFDHHQRGDDRYENNYDPAHAGLIALGEEISGLNFACPVGNPPDCGDQDWYQVQLKPSACYTAETKQLSPGLDTNLIVYGPQADQAPPLAGNDDVALGHPESLAAWCLPAGRELVTVFLLVGNSGIPPEPRKARTYALRVGLAVPATPTARPAPAPASTVALPPQTPLAGPPAGTLMAPTAPPAETPFVAAPAASLEASPTETPAQRTATLTATPALPPMKLTPLEVPAPTVSAALTSSRIPVVISVRVLRAKTSSQSASSDEGLPVAGARVQLVDAFGELLAEALMPASGELVLRRDIPQGTALFVRVPAYGLQMAISLEEPTLLFMLPPGGGR